MPDVAVVKHSTTWTRCEASAGGTPITPTSKVLEMTPKAMPSAPSTACAAKPTAMNGNKALRSMFMASHSPGYLDLFDRDVTCEQRESFSAHRRSEIILRRIGCQKSAAAR